MKALMLLAALALAGLSTAHAAVSTCEGKADEKKIVGAEKSKFIAQCAATMETCKVQADQKKLVGMSRQSFVRHCVFDAPQK